MKLFGARSCPWQALLAYVLKAEYGLSPLPEIARTPRGKAPLSRPARPALQRQPHRGLGALRRVRLLCGD